MQYREAMELNKKNTVVVLKRRQRKRTLVTQMGRKTWDPLQAESPGMPKGEAVDQFC